MYTTFLKKEFRQNAVLAPAMIFLCFLFQVAYFELGHMMNYRIDPGAFFFMALIVTALYAGAATALAYSTEHAENTFGFLRKLPITEGTIAAGKISWALIGTVLVLAGNLLLCLIWGGGADSNTSLAIGVGIAEAFVWGLYWSTRCKSQINALLAGYACASLTAWLITNLCIAHNSDVASMYADAAVYRLIAVVIVAILAVWGALHWFRFEITPPLSARWFTHDSHRWRYPKAILTPFSALVHQHIRNANIIYPLGILAFALFAFTWLVVTFFFYKHLDSGQFPGAWIFVSTLYACIAIFVLFWSMIFGHDQRNETYRFLSRLGIPAGRVWWSRMLLPGILYAMTFICYLAGCLFPVIPILIHEWLHEWRSLDNSNITLGALLEIWFAVLRHVTGVDVCWLFSVPLTLVLIIMSVGAFISISFRSQIVAIALSFAGVLVLSAWMMFFIWAFDCSPLWTTLPIAVALLVASRIRAEYWLRETRTWRSRFVPLYPVFGAILAVFIALPFVRIYSLPNVTWAEIQSSFDKAKYPDADLLPRNPERRNALIQYIAAHHSVPPEYEAFYEDLKNRDYHWNGGWEHRGDCTYEEYLLLVYVFCRETLCSPIEWTEDNQTITRDLTRYTPWEAYRIDRALRIQLAAWASGKGDEFYRNPLHERYTFGKYFFDYYVWGSFAVNAWSSGNLTSDRMRVARDAIEKYYEKQGALPKSLDEFRKYLHSSIEHPFSGESVEYFYNAAPLPEGEIDKRYPLFVLYLNAPEDNGSLETKRDREERDRVEWNKFLQTGGTYLRLHGRVWLIVELPKEKTETQ